jgi:hypothetical protein
MSSPYEIANELGKFMSNIILSGPTSFYICTPTQKAINLFGRNCPVLMLLGDRHVGQEMCHITTIIKSGREHKSLYDKSFINDLNTFVKDHNIIADIFLETWTNEEAVNIPNHSSFFNFHNYLRHCYTKLRNDHLCPAKDIRTHYSDPRKRSGDAEHVWFMIAKCNSYTEFSNEFYKHYFYASADSVLDHVIKRLKSGANVLGIFKDYEFFQRYSKVIVEISQLPKEMQGIIYHLYHKYMKHAFPKYEGQISPFSKTDYPMNVHYGIFNDEENFEYIKKVITPFVNLNTGQCSIHWFGEVPTLDLYFLARALKSPIGNLPSQLSILYAGSLHVGSLVYFLMYESDLYTISDIGNNHMKCVEVKPFHKVTDNLYKKFLHKNVDLEIIYRFVHPWFLSFLLAAFYSQVFATRSARAKLLDFFKANPETLEEVLIENSEYIPYISSYSSGEIDRFSNNRKSSLLRLLWQYTECKDAILLNKAFFIYYIKDSLHIEELIQDKYLLTESWQSIALIEYAYLFDRPQLLLDYLYNYAQVSKDDRLDTRFLSKEASPEVYELLFEDIRNASLSKRVAIRPLTFVLYMNNIKLIQDVLDNPAFEWTAENLQCFHAYLKEHSNEQLIKHKFKRFHKRWKLTTDIARVIKDDNDNLSYLFMA